MHTPLEQLKSEMKCLTLCRVGTLMIMTMEHFKAYILWLKSLNETKIITHVHRDKDNYGFNIRLTNNVYFKIGSNTNDYV